jgi:hypothetical protein
MQDVSDRRTKKQTSVAFGNLLCNSPFADSLFSRNPHATALLAVRGAHCPLLNLFGKGGDCFVKWLKICEEALA